VFVHRTFATKLRDGVARFPRPKPLPVPDPRPTTAFGSQRLVSGSDYCCTPTPGVTAQVNSIDDALQPAGDAWRALTTRNAQRLFPRRNDRA
jgi:hypothetical protein